MIWNLRYIECDGCGDPYPSEKGLPKPATGWECTIRLQKCPKCLKKAASKAAGKATTQ